MTEDEKLKEQANAAEFEGSQSEIPEEKPSSGAFNTGGSFGSDFSRLRRTVKDEQQILTLKRMNQLLMLLVAGLLIFMEYRDGKLPELNKLLGTPLPAAEQVQAQAEEVNNLPPEKEMVSYPFDDYMLDKSKQPAEGHSDDSVQDSH